MAHFGIAAFLIASARAPKRRTCTTFLSQSPCFINGIDPVYIPGSVIDLVTSVIAETMASSQISRWPMTPEPPPIMTRRPIVVVPAIPTQPEMIV